MSDKQTEDAQWPTPKGSVSEEFAERLGKYGASPSFVDDIEDVRLSARQYRILEFIRDYVGEHGFPPSVREIGAAVGLVSPSSVAHQLVVLEQKGFLQRNPARPRAVKIETPTDSAANSGEADRTGSVPNPDEADVNGASPSRKYPGTFGVQLPAEIFGDGDAIMVKVPDDAMGAVALNHGDWVIVKPGESISPGDVVAAYVDGDVVVRHYLQRDGRGWVTSASTEFESVPAGSATVIGRVSGVLRPL